MNTEKLHFTHFTYFFPTFLSWVFFNFYQMLIKQKCQKEILPNSKIQFKKIFWLFLLKFESLVSFSSILALWGPKIKIWKNSIKIDFFVDFFLKYLAGNTGLLWLAELSTEAPTALSVLNFRHLAKFKILQILVTKELDNHCVSKCFKEKWNENLYSPIVLSSLNSR